MGRGTVKDDGGHTSTAHHAPGSRRIAPGEMGESAGHGKMHLTSAIVKRFKSIDDSEVVRFEPDVTCLVGRNESGKTAFLEALARLNPLADDPLAFDELRDYPRRLRGSEEEIAATVPVSATFELDDADVDDLWGEFGPGVVTSRTVRLDRTYGGRRRCGAGLLRHRPGAPLPVLRPVQRAAWARQHPAPADPAADPAGSRRADRPLAAAAGRRGRRRLRRVDLRAPQGGAGGRGRAHRRRGAALLEPGARPRGRAGRGLPA